MFEVQMLIPVQDNDGLVFDEAHHAAFEKEVVARFGGVTRFPATAVGSWVDEGKTYHDETRVYGMVVRSLGDGNLVKELAEFAKDHYRQEAIFVRYLGQAEIL